MDVCVSDTSPIFVLKMATPAEGTRSRKRRLPEEDANKGTGGDADKSCSPEKKKKKDKVKAKFGAMKDRSAPVIYEKGPLKVECGKVKKVEKPAMPLKVTCKPKIVGQASMSLEAGASVSMGLTGALDMIDNFDRPGKASADKTYAGTGSFAYGCEDKPGRRLPKAGVYATAGVGHAKAEFSVFEAQAKGPNASAGVGASVGSLSAGAFARAEVASASASAGPLKASVGLALDTGVGVGLTGVDCKVLGTGFSFGRKIGFSLFGSGFEFKLW